jgi:hypothetical protein
MKKKTMINLGTAAVVGLSTCVSFSLAAAMILEECETQTLLMTIAADLNTLTSFAGGAAAGYFAAN